LVASTDEFDGKIRGECRGHGLCSY
jgi:hypothetical protein